MKDGKSKISSAPGRVRKTAREASEDSKLMALALARKQSFDPEKALSHEYMMEKFGGKGYGV